MTLEEYGIISYDKFLKKDQYDLRVSYRYLLKKDMVNNMSTLITAHSGCENTEMDGLESIDKAIEYGADVVEMDVRVAPNGILRISHNELSEEEYEQKITFRDVIEKILPTSLSLNVDLKEQEGLYPVIREAKALGFPQERLIFSGCVSPEQLVRDPLLRKKADFFVNVEEVLKIVYFKNSSGFHWEKFGKLMKNPWETMNEDGQAIPEEYVDDVVQCYKQLPISAANLPKRLLGTQLVASLQDAGVPLSIWTVNEPEIVEQCLDLNVLNITTRQVEQAVRLKNQRNQ